LKAPGQKPVAIIVRQYIGSSRWREAVAFDAEAMEIQKGLVFDDEEEGWLVALIV
jgi:hypothetical protein